MTTTLSKALGLMLILSMAPMIGSARHRHHATSSAPGEFDYYLLSLSWSPAFCLQSPDSTECNGPRRFGFIVHGLWPQNERGWPQNCDANAELPDSVAQQVADLMPARKLVMHEWSTHGTCSGLGPEDYFALMRRAFASLTIPAPLTRPNAAVEQSPDVIVDEFMKTNPRLRAQSVVVTCTRQGAPRLREVHVCFDRDLNSRACSADALREACGAATVIVPPVR